MDLYIEGLTAGNISLSGDEGLPNVKIVGASSATVDVKDVLGNTQFCTDAATFITNSRIRVRVGNASGRILTASQMSAIQIGTLFDLDSDGVADRVWPQRERHSRSRYLDGRHRAARRSGAHRHQRSRPRSRQGDRCHHDGDCHGGRQRRAVRQHRFRRHRDLGDHRPEDRRHLPVAVFPVSC